MRPIVRPLVRRLDDHVNDHFARFMGQLSIWNSQQNETLRQIELLGDSMVREMARLHAQIALLEADLSDALNPPAATPEIEAADELRRRNRAQAA